MTNRETSPFGPTVMRSHAINSGITTACLAGGVLAANVPLLSVLAKHSAGGEVWGHASGWASPLLPAALRTALSRRFATSAQLDVHVSSGLKLVNWLGPVEVLEGEQWRAVAGPLSPNACAVAGGLQVRLCLLLNANGECKQMWLRCCSAARSCVLCAGLIIWVALPFGCGCCTLYIFPSIS